MSRDTFAYRQGCGPDSVYSYRCKSRFKSDSAAEFGAPTAQEQQKPWELRVGTAWCLLVKRSCKTQERDKMTGASLSGAIPPPRSAERRILSNNFRKATKA